PASPEAAPRAAAPLPGATRAPTPAIEVLTAVFLGERGRAVLQVRRWHTQFDDAGRIAASGLVVEPFLLALPPTAAQCDAALAWLWSHRDVEDAAVVLHVDGHPVAVVALPADTLDAVMQEVRRQVAGYAGAEAGTAGGDSANDHAGANGADATAAGAGADDGRERTDHGTANDGAAIKVSAPHGTGVL